MKKLILLFLVVVPVLVYSQKSKFYLNTLDLEQATFKDLGRGTVKALFLNRTINKLKIMSVRVVVTVTKTEKPCDRCGGQGSVPGPGEEKTFVYQNESQNFARYANYTFSIANILALYPQDKYNLQVTFAIKEIRAETEEGQNWIDNIMYSSEQKVTYRLDNNPHFRAKGEIEN